MTSVVRKIGDLDAALTLAPERYPAPPPGDATDRHVRHVPLAARILERNERVAGDALRGALILDTAHVKDGVLDLASAARVTMPSSSAKKRVRPGDLLVSRLRPYLRQIGYAHPVALAPYGARLVACSTEFYVLTPRDPSDALGDLVPWLLGARAQAALAAAQEGGHHPRVPRAVLLAMRVPWSSARARRARARAVSDALALIYAAAAAYARLLD